jgi:predicted MFS family arabinose efflux permease
MHRSHPDQPTLITTAPESSEDEFNRRRKRYAIMMALRAVCVVIAAVSYQWSILVALACLIAGAVLPWCAVLIANDGPPKKRARALGVPIVSTERALPPGAEQHTVDG